MEAQYQTYASLDDIVFEGRNKAYGAYALRQDYEANVKKATALSLAGFLFLFGWGFWAVKNQPEIIKELVPKITTCEFNLIDPPILDRVEPPKPATTAAAPASAVSTKEFKIMRVVPNETPVTQTIANQSDFTNADPGLITATGDPAGTVVPVDEPGTGTGNGTETEVTTPFIHVEQMPEFEGGLPALYKFINKHLRYPKGALNQGLEGNVILSFVVSASGQISDIQVMKDIGGGAGEEAIRVVSKMPNWKPGIQNHRPVPVRFTLPIRFTLN